MFYQQTRRMIDKGGSGRSSVGSESPRVSVSKPNHMRDTINGQRATIAKLFEQGNIANHFTSFSIIQVGLGLELIVMLISSDICTLYMVRYGLFGNCHIGRSYCPCKV